MKHLVVVLLAFAPLTAHADKTFTGTRQGRWDCAKEPNVHILHGEGSYVFKGNCSIITVEGGNNRLVIEAVDALRIVGANNNIDVGTLRQREHHRRPQHADLEACAVGRSATDLGDRRRQQGRPGALS